MLSYQSHNYRTELWIVVKGKVSITKDGETHVYDADPQKIHSVGKGIKHRIYAIEEARIIEISFGYYDDNDIIRYEDKYGRIDAVSD